jgi:glycosyltransferase involved in cell wall biosynthesis
MRTARTGNDAKISVIVPAFKAEGSIEKCVRSLLCQEHKNLEVLVVDDCSPDRLGVVVEELATEDSRVRLLRPAQNVGVHAARGMGLAAATGDYIGYVDGDDFVQHSMYSTLLKRIEEDDASIAICGAALFSNEQRLKVQRVGIRRTEVVSEGVLSRFCRLKFGSGVLWNKLYRRDVILSSGLQELEREVDGSEDYIVNFGAFASANRVTLCTEPLYNFVAHAGNVSGEKGWPVFARLLRSYVVCLEKYAAVDAKFAPLIDHLYLKLLHYDEYSMDRNDRPEPEIVDHIAASLRRMADANSLSIYSILQALPSRYAKVERVLKALGRW